MQKKPVFMGIWLPSASLKDTGTSKNLTSECIPSFRKPHGYKMFIIPESPMQMSGIFFQKYHIYLLINHGVCTLLICTVFIGQSIPDETLTILMNSGYLKSLTNIQKAISLWYCLYIFSKYDSMQIYLVYQNLTLVLRHL